MSSLNPSQRAVLAFLLAVLLATAAGAVCVAFGATAMPVPMGTFRLDLPQSVSASLQSRQARDQGASREAIRTQPAASAS